ncbi:MAG: ABC-2 family transporter protein [Gemmataceae bacterium]|nr:ABC-2 family transporter protein [Gemmataceae bacterium]
MRPTTNPPDAGATVDGAALALPLPSPMLHVHPLRKYWKIFRTSLTERLAYRADFFLSTLLRFLPMVTTILLWQAVYAAAGAGASRGGFTMDQMISYLLLVHISRMFSSMPGLAQGIARDIRSGNLKKYLLQPIEMLPYLLSYRVAHKCAYIATSALPYGILFFLCRDYFTLPTDPGIWAGYVTTLLLGFLVGFFFEATLGMLGFWFLEVGSFLYVINTVNYFVSGQMFPLDLLPGWLADVLKFLPFKYLAYFPATILLGKVQGQELVQGLLIEAAWAAGFIVLARWLYRLGLRRYSAYGG